MEKACNFIKWLVIGRFDGSNDYFTGPQCGLIETYESSLRVHVASLFAEEAHKKLRGKFEKQLDDLDGMQGLDRLEGLSRIDSGLVAAIPNDILLARRWIVVDRFRRIASARAYQAYEASLPAATDSDRAKDPAKLRPDLLNISNYVQQSYLLNLERERALASIKWWLLSRAAGLGLIAALIVAAAATPAPFELLAVAPAAPAIGLVLLTGMVGAMTSISRKFQDLARSNVLEGDPFNDIVALNAGRPSVAVSIGSGGIFALVLYGLVAAGPLSQSGSTFGLFPSTDSLNQFEVRCVPKSRPLIDDQQARAADRETGDGKGCKPSEELEPIPPKVDDTRLPVTVKRLAQDGLGFASGSDLLRMLLLAFIAGFAERLVPDTIDRLIKREKSVRGD